MTRFVTVILVLFLVLMAGNQVMAQAPYDTVSIYDLQYVADPASDDASPYNRDTLVVRAMVMHSPRALYVGARWACYVVDPDSFYKPWSGFFLIQNDTINGIGTNFGFVEPGMIIYATGVIDEYVGFTELALLTDPVVPIDIESAGNTLPEPLKLTVEDLDGFANGEQWESMYIMIENATIVSNGLSSNTASITDASEGTAFLDDYFMYYRSRFDNDPNYDWPPPGTNINVTGHVRDTGPGNYTVNPENDTFLEILTIPPLITGVRRNPGIPTSSDDVVVTATITDNVSVDTAIVYYSVDWGAIQGLGMTADADTFSATIPKQADGSVVRFYIYAEDNSGEWTTSPGDTSSGFWIYPVRDGALTIKDIQYTFGYDNDSSPYRDFGVTVRGIIVTDSTDFPSSTAPAFYFIQEKDSAWYGIRINGNQHPYLKGDLVEVTGTVAETYGVTRITDVTSVSLISSGNAFTPVPVKTGDINTAGDHGEAYESVLIELNGLTVTDELPDAPGNYGEFVVDDGSGGLRIDDWDINDPPRPSFRGNYDNTYANGDSIEKIIAMGYYSFRNYKIMPRDTSDVIGHLISGIGDEITGQPLEFILEQNYPNPFNPDTKITYQVNRPGNYALTVYNVLGQAVHTLVSEFHNTGTYTMTWNGLDQQGHKVGSGLYFYRLQGEGFVMTKKMVLLK